MGLLVTCTSDRPIMRAPPPSACRLQAQPGGFLPALQQLANVATLPGAQGCRVPWLMPILHRHASRHEVSCGGATHLRAGAALPAGIVGASTGMPDLHSGVSLLH